MLVEKREHLYTTGIIWQTGVGTVENSMEASQKTENRTTMWPSNSTPGNISKKNTNSKRYRQSNAHLAALFTIAKIWKQRKSPSTDEWVKTMWYVYTVILISHKKERKFVTCNNMDGLGGCYAKWNKSNKERQILYDLTYMWNLKKYNRLGNITTKENRLKDMENQRLPLG